MSLETLELNKKRERLLTLQWKAGQTFQLITAALLSMATAQKLRCRLAYEYSCRRFERL